MNRIIPFLTLMLFAAMPAMAQFSSTVAVSGNQVIAGGTNNQISPGALYVYERSGPGTWSETGTIQASDAQAGDAFGSTASLSGDVLAVGAPGTGTVHLFERSMDGSWQETGQVTTGEENFGSMVALDGDNLLVGARPGRFGNATVTAFRRSGGQWQQAGTLSVDDLQEDIMFGSALALDGDHAAVGAARANEGAGGVFAFRYDSTLGHWVANGTPASPFATSGSMMGSSIEIMGRHMAVGLPGHDNRMGAVAVFMLDDESGTWEFNNRVSPISSQRGDGFGAAMGHFNSKLWVGASGANDRSGLVFTFDADPETGRIVQSDTFPADLPEGSAFGSSFAGNGEIVVIGAARYKNGGAAVPFARMGSGWEQGTPVYHDPEGYVAVKGGTVGCEQDMAGDFPCKGVDMLSFLDMDGLGADRGTRTNDIWGWEDPETGREYAIVGIINQTSFVDVTDAENPIYLGKLPLTSTARPSVWRDMKVYKDHAFIVADGAGEHGMQVFDLRQLRNVENAPVTFEETTHYGGIFSSHNIVINEDTGFAYAVGNSSGGETCGGGLHMINIQDPANPTFAGCYADGETGRRGTGYSHDAQCVTYHGPDADYDGREVCLGANETALSIADVTDKSAPVTVSIATYPKTAYAHQGWLTEDHRYFYMNDEGDEPQGLVEGTRTLIWDLADLDDPVLVGEYIAQTTETDHNLYVKGNLMYQSNYGAGFRVLDVSNPEAPVEVGFFDTSPVGGSGGSWSNYPYFKSGTIVVTGGSNGLFVLKKKEVDV